MELPIRKSKTLRDGMHKGVITKIEYRTDPYEYTDIIIESEGAQLKSGYPTAVMPNSKLGQLLERFGENLEREGTTDPDKILIGKNCQFMTILKKTAAGTFSNVLPDTLMPEQVPG